MTKTPALVTAAVLTAVASSVAYAQTAKDGIPMTGTTPMHPWFDWIFFAIVVPWLVFAAWDLVRTR